MSLVIKSKQRGKIKNEEINLQINNINRKEEPIILKPKTETWRKSDMYIVQMKGKIKSEKKWKSKNSNYPQIRKHVKILTFS